MEQEQVGRFGFADHATRQSPSPAVSALRAGIVSAALLLVACDSRPPYEAQSVREAEAFYALVTDNQGCVWRLSLKHGRLVEAYRQYRRDGSIDCPKPEASQGGAS